MKKIISLIFCLFIFISNSYAFIDSASFYWAEGAINRWTERGYISGYEDFTFRGNNNITRAEVICVINKINNSKENVNKRYAKDIDINDWFFYEMGKAFYSNLISLDEFGCLRPNDYATREEVMYIFGKLFNVSYTGNFENAKANNFLDANEINPEYYSEVFGIIEDGFFNGYYDNTLRPKGNITRAEFIVALDNAIKEIYSYGSYRNCKINGNIVINGEDVKIVNSDILGKVFVLDGAKNHLPTLINTNASKGINSRVGEILIKISDEYETVTEKEVEKDKEDINSAITAKITYSEKDWTNDDVKVFANFNNRDIKIIKDKIVFEKNGKDYFEYEYKGNTSKIFVEVDNIDKTKPKVSAEVNVIGNEAKITVNYTEDGLSPIDEIYCSVGKYNYPEGENGIIDNTFTVYENGTYTVIVRDEAGNSGRVKVTVTGIVNVTN